MPGGAKPRAKGAGFEREVATALRPIFPHVERAWEAAQGKGYDLLGIGNLDFQCKRYKGSVPMSKLKEVPVRKGRIAVLASRTDREEALVTLRLADFVAILEDVAVAYSNDDLGLKE
jgi:hypothetical protein